MSELPEKEGEPKPNPWLQPRTIEDERNRDILSAVCFRYFTILVGAIFALVLAKPESASGTFWLPGLQLRAVVYWYSIVGVFGIIGFESYTISARRRKSQITLPFLAILGFGLFVMVGLCIFFELFRNLLGLDANVA